MSKRKALPRPADLYLTQEQRRALRVGVGDSLVFRSRGQRFKADVLHAPAEFVDELNERKAGVLCAGGTHSMVVLEGRKMVHVARGGFFAAGRSDEDEPPLWWSGRSRATV